MIDNNFTLEDIKSSDLSDNYKEILISDFNRIKKEWSHSDKIENLNRKYEIYKKFSEIKKDLQKQNISTASRLKINRIISEIENKSIIYSSDIRNLDREIITDKSLNSRKDLLWINFWDSYRNFVKSNIDFRWTAENISETDFIKDFYNIFSNKYRPYIENKYKKVMDFDNKEWLNIEKDELIKMINETKDEIFSNNKVTYKDIKYTVLFDLKDWLELIQDIINPIIKTQKEAEGTKNNISNKIQKKQNKIIKDETIETVKVKKISNNQFDKWLNKVTKSEKSRENINVSEKLKNEEANEDFLYWEFIEKYWLPESSKNLLKKLLIKYLNWEHATVRVDLWGWKYQDKTIVYTNKKWLSWDFYNIAENSQELINNLEKIIVLSLKIESGWWKNIWNYNNSWAEWYFQLHTKNWTTWYEKMLNSKYCDISKEEYIELKKQGVEWIRTVNKSNSFQTAINYLAIRYKKLEKNGKIKVPILWWKIVDVSKKSIIWINSPMELNAEEQTNLWLVDLFERIKDDRKEYLANMLIWSQWDAKQFYNKIQHTAPDALTNKVVNNFMIDVWKMEILI